MPGTTYATKYQHYKTEFVLCDLPERPVQALDHIRSVISLLLQRGGSIDSPQVRNRLLDVLLDGIFDC